MFSSYGKAIERSRYAASRQRLIPFCSSFGIKVHNE
jgi:hypothetical protein